MTCDHVLGLLGDIKRQNFVLADLRFGQFEERVLLVISRFFQIIRVYPKAFEVQLLTDKVLVSRRSQKVDVLLVRGSRARHARFRIIIELKRCNS